MRHLIWFFTVISLALAGCSGTSVCDRDSDCDPGHFCSAETASCNPPGDAGADDEDGGRSALDAGSQQDAGGRDAALPDRCTEVDCSSLDGECMQGVCNPSTGACETAPRPVGATCGDTGVECLVDDTCDGDGTCVDNGFAPESTACGDSSSDACNAADSCDGAGTCSPNWAALGEPCGATGVECSVDDTCDGAGACTDNGLASEGAPCDDGNACTTDSCDAAGACVGVEITCPSPAACQNAVCNPDSGACEPVDLCVDDGNPCTVDQCNTTTDVCGVIDPACSCIYQKRFFCGDTSFTYMTVEGDIQWNVDARPFPPGYASQDCSLNFNDDVDSYGSTVGPSHGSARSPLIALPARSANAWLWFLSYLDTEDPPSSNWDNATVTLNGDPVTPPIDDGDRLRWMSLLIDVSAYRGRGLQVGFVFDSFDDNANDGAGWFVDDICILVPPAEVCDDGADNDFDGDTDGDDSDCP